MELIIIRHGQSVNNSLPEQQRSEDPPLTELGKLQCQKLTSWLSTESPELLITSPFRRALETTDHIHRELGTETTIWVDLHEQGGCQSGSDPECYIGQPGMNDDQIRREFPNYAFGDPIGSDGWWKSQPYETLDKARIRVIRLIDRIVNRFADDPRRIAFVMHGTFKMLWLRHWLGPDFSGGHLGVVYNSAVTKLSLRGGEPELVYFNKTAHLEPSELSL